MGLNFFQSFSLVFFFSIDWAISLSETWFSTHTKL